MENYSAFSKNHKCLNWMDYQLARFESKETNETYHENWIKIQRLYTRNQSIRGITQRCWY